MKKAAEYAADYRANQTDKTLGVIIQRFFGEFAELAKARGVTTMEGYLAILDEQDRKWRAFARHFEGLIYPDGFEKMVKAQFLPVYKVWRRK